MRSSHHPTMLSDDVSSQVSVLTSRLRKALEAAEDELLCETTHAKKFMFRGDGLRTDFMQADRSRRRALLKGTLDNEAALCTAIRDAESAGLPQQYLEDAIRTQAELAICKAELWQLYIASSDT